ncbi:GON-4 isoform X1, partial [Paramuricea clavata]
LQTQSTPIPDGEEIGMTLQQKQCVIAQLQKHTQLLAQVSLLCKGQADFSFVAETCEGLLQDMVRLNDVATSDYVSRLVVNKGASPTVFSSVGLNEAVRVINQPLSSITPVGTPSTTKPGDESRVTTAAPIISEEVVKIIRSSPIFLYKGLLPHIPFQTQKTISGRGEKFLQCEDNLLVLGIDQYAHNWTEIKKHYLPVKTLKQIKIRRKNLCSKRAPDNVVKQYRDTGKIPMLPTIPATLAMEECLRPTIFSAPNEKGTSSLWFKKLNEQQTPQSLSAKKIAKRKKNVKTNDVTVAISPRSFIYKIPTIILEDPKCDMDATKDVVVSSQPPLPGARNNNQFKNTNDSKNLARINISSSKEKMRTILPNPKPSPKDTQQVPTTPRPQSLQNEILNHACSPLNDIPTGATTDHAMLQGSEKENIQPVSEETHIENVDNCNTENLRTDTNEDIKIRAISYAQSYLSNVKKEVKEDSLTYQAFLKVLVDSRTNTWSPTKLYKEVAVVLKDFPDLVRDFAGFLEPHQALDAGLFMTNKAILKARIFLQRVESHFSKNPSHFQKIIKAFSTFNSQESKSSQLYDAVIPLLKGQQYLIEEFNSFFNNLKPQPSHSDDFEEVELGSGSEIEVDDFEEVIIPDVKKNLTKTRDFGKTPMKPPGRSMSRKHRRVKKDDANDKNIDGNVVDYDKDNDITEDIADRPEEVNDDIGDNYDKALDSDEDYDEPIDKINSDSETRENPNDTQSMPLLTKYTSDLSNPSSPASECKSVDDLFDEDYIESPETTQESQVTSASEGASDLSNEATDPALSNASPTSLEQCENREQTEETPHIKVGNKHKKNDVISKPEDVDCSPDRIACGSTQATEETCKEGNEIINIEECSDDFDNRISANNLEVDEDGKSVIWTREDDKKILQLCQSRGLSDNIYEDIAQELDNKTAAQVDIRHYFNFFR